MYIKYPHYVRRNIKLLSLGALCLVSSFAIGVQTAGEVQPFTIIEAGGLEQAGDIDGNGFVDLQDAIAILEISEGYASASPEQLRADPNGDGVLTVSDAMAILSTISLQ